MRRIRFGQLRLNCAHRSAEACSPGSLEIRALTNSLDADSRQMYLYTKIEL